MHHSQIQNTWVSAYLGLVDQYVMTAGVGWMDLSVITQQLFEEESNFLHFLKNFQAFLH